MNANKVRHTLTWTQKAAVIGAAVGSILPVFVMLQNSFQGYIGSWIVSSILAGLLTALIAAVVEYGMSVYFPYSVKSIFEGRVKANNWRSWILYPAMLLLAFFFMFTSGFLSFEGRKQIGQAVAGKAETKDIEQTAANIAGLERENVRTAKTNIAHLEREIAAKTDAVRKARPDLVAASGNAYLQGLLKKMIDSETAADRKQLEQARATLDRLLQNSSVSKAIASTTAENEIVLQQWQKTLHTSEQLSGYFGIFCILVFGVATVLLILFEIEEGPQPIRKSSPTPPGYAPVSGSGAGADVKRMAETALKVSYETRDELETLKAETPEKSKPETKRIPETETRVSETRETPKFQGRPAEIPETVSSVSKSGISIPTEKDIVSENGVSRIWISGFETEPFTLTQCRSKLRQYENKLQTGKGKAETNRANIRKFKAAIDLLK